MGIFRPGNKNFNSSKKSRGGTKTRSVGVSKSVRSASHEKALRDFKVRMERVRNTMGYTYGDEDRSTSSVSLLYSGGYHEKIPQSYKLKPTMTERLGLKDNEGEGEESKDDVVGDNADEVKQFLKMAGQLKKEKFNLKKKIVRSGPPSVQEVRDMVESMVLVHEENIKSQNATSNPIMFTKIKRTRS